MHESPTRRLDTASGPVVHSNPALRSLRISVTGDRLAGREYTVESPRAIVGRGENVDVRVDDETVSQFHLELELTSDGIGVRDLDSTNGVRVGGVRIRRGTVPFGCPLTIGMTVIRAEPTETQGGPAISVPGFGGLVGQSVAMRELYAVLVRLARSDLSVVFQGPTGTGKEEAARALHQCSARSQNPFVVLDCTTMPPHLASSCLFGHERGAFTDAVERRVGVFEAAHGGVLFIDELGELPIDLQPLLLRVLQRREVVPIGSTRPKPVDVRVISATNRDLRAMVNRGTFREDLYYRLAQATVWMPSLADRPDDIPLLVEHFLTQIPQSTVAARMIAQEALTTLMSRDYPGNIRELRNTVERLAKITDGPTITNDELAFERLLVSSCRRSPLDQREDGRERTVDEENLGIPIQPFKEAKRTLIDEFERAYLLRLMERTNQNISKAATLAGVERHNLRDLLKKHSLYANNL